MSISTRLAKLERHGMTGDIPVWCGDEADVPATIQAMLAEGARLEPLCVLGAR